MVSNTSNATFEAGFDLGFCTAQDSWEKCFSIAVGYQKIVTYVNSPLAILINILHSSVLYRMNKKSAKPYLLLLIHMSVADLLTPAIDLIKGNCYAMSATYGASKGVAIILSTLVELPTTTRFFMIALLSYERFAAICQPFRYPSRLVVTRTTAIALLLWGISLVLLLVRDIIFSKFICINIYYGITSVDKTLESLLYQGFLNGIPLVTACVLSVLVTVELVKMDKRVSGHDAHGRGSHDARRVAIYTIVNNILFVLCITPFVIAPFIPYWFLRFFVYILFIFYGILNTVIYGWMMKSYRATLFQMLCCCCKGSANVFSSGRPDSAADSSVTNTRHTDVNNNTSV